MLSANDMMIGDWVISNKRGKSEIVKVVSIDGGTNCCWLDADCFSGLVACEDIESIPLTPEIFEKNGFVLLTKYRGTTYYGSRKPMDSYMLDTKPYIQFAFNEFIEPETSNKTANSLMVKRCRDGYSPITIMMECAYVHELQHALRLCGLDELADGFKV